METLGQRHYRIYEELKSARAQLEAYWQDIMYYCLPRKSYITRIRNSGDKIPADIYDSTAILSLAYFAAGMQAYMSSPQTKWFSIGLRNRNLLRKKSVMDYLRDSEDALYDIINNSNFYQEDVESYLGLGSVGSDVIYSEEDIKETVRFDCLPIENVLVTVDATGRCNAAYMEYEYSSEQALGKFGDKAGPKVKDCYAKGDFVTKFKYRFCVYPREVYNVYKKDAKNMPFASIWIDCERKEVVSEKGYKEFPFHLSRFAKAKFDAYGYSPAMNVLPDIKMMNQMEKVNILGAQTAVRPAVEIPDEAFMRPYNLNPGGQNVRASGYPNEHIVPIQTGANVPLGLDYIQYKKQGIQQAFYNDLFLAIEQIGKRTATEVQIRNNQRMQMLGSAVGNIMREKLSPIIERTYAIAARNRMLPELPPELQGEEYVIEYISPLARAQKALELQNLQQAIQIIASFGQVSPEVFDKIDFDEVVDYTAEVTNITPKIIRDDSEVADIRAGRAQENAAAQQMAMYQQGVDITKSATEADKNAAEMQAVGAK